MCLEAVLLVPTNSAECREKKPKYLFGVFLGIRPQCRRCLCQGDGMEPQLGPGPTVSRGFKEAARLYPGVLALK